MNQETLEALGWLGNLELTQYQETTLDRACAENPEAFRRLAAWAADADSPMAGLMTGAVRLLKDAELVGKARGMASDTASEKRVRSALNYSQTALGVIPVAEQEQVLRDEFPWIGGELLGRCLLIGANAAALQDADMASLEKGVSEPVREPEHDWPMPRSFRAAQFWSDPKHWIPDAGARWCDLPDGHPMKHPLDMDVIVKPLPDEETRGEVEETRGEDPLSVQLPEMP